MQPIRIASLFLISCSETYASAFSAGITETERLSSLPTLNCTVPSTKAKRVWSFPCNQLFEPKMDAAQREKLVRGWHKAVGRSQDWAEHEV